MSTEVDKPCRLWSSGKGRIACTAHMPEIATAAWWADTWRVMGEHEQEGFTRARGEAPQCEACVALALLEGES